MGVKQVVLNPYIRWDGVDRADQFGSFMPDTLRAEIEASVYGTSTDTFESGTFKHTLKVLVRPDADQAFVKVLLVQYNGGANIPVVYRAKDAAKSATNPEMRFSVLVTKGPPLGADRGKLQEASMDILINTPIEWDDGTDVITIG